MIDDTTDETGTDPPSIGEGFVRASASYRRSEQTRKMAEDIKKRSAEIRIEAERVRSMSMIILLNADMNFKAAQKAHKGVLEGPSRYRRNQDSPPDEEPLD